MKTKITQGIAFSFIIFLFLFPLKETIAVTAYPYPFEYKQPDGSIIAIQLKGDEKVHWAETMDGYSLLNNGKDGWEYAVLDSNGDLKCSGILAREPKNRSAQENALLLQTPKQLFFSKSQVNILLSIWNAKSPNGTETFNPNGNKNLVMILIGYTDLAFTKTQADFNNLMNQIGYNQNGAVGSVKDFFLENSYNLFDITTTVAGPYTAAQNMAYYGANDINGDDINARALITEAVYLADPDVNYANFDNDGDGGVDGVYVIYAGYGEAGGGSANTIWPHAGGIPNVTLDGKTISKYSCSNELRGSSGTNMTTIGVICHEFGHVCGSPDYYDTDYATSGQYDGTGSWDLMAGGSWNGTPAGCSPPHMMPIDKIRNTWIMPTQLTTDASISLSDITTNPVVYRFNTATSNEYYLIENKQKTGFNSSVPGHGLMIYHVDGNYISTAGNSINCTPHQGMFPMSAIATNANGVHTQADNMINRSGCPWPGSSGKTTFTDITTPNAKDWSGNNTNGALINIAEAGGVISLCYKSCPAINPVFNLAGASPNGSQIDLSWIRNATNNDVILAWNSTNTFGDPANGTPYNVGDVLSGGGTILYKGPASSFNHNGLSPSTVYYYKIWSMTSTPNYSAGTLANAQTLCSSVVSYPITEGFEGGVIPGCWTQSNMIGANPWVIQTSGINGHPSSAHSGTKLARCNVLIQNAGYVTKLISPPIDLSGIQSPTLKFWHTQDSWDGRQDILRVYYRTSGTSVWNELAVYTSSIAAWTAETINLPNPTANYFIAFEATVNAGYGVCIDDIRVGLPVADFTVDGNVNCTGSLTVNFTDNSFGPNGSWAWDIDNNGTTDYTTQNPTHNYSSPGLYSAKLTINNGVTSTTKENLILIMSNEPTVNTGCALSSNSNAGNGYGIGISRFALGNIDYSTSSNDGYYNNYACSKWTVLELNNSYNTTIRTGTANNEGAKIYIDYNDNGIFEAGESVVSFPSNMTGTRTLSFTTPSTGVVLDKGIRLRVLSKFSGVPVNACDIGGYGQAEDYTVYFTNQRTWDGSADTDWFTAENWTNSLVPASNTKIIIPSGCASYPVLINDVICGGLSIGIGASVTVNPAKAFTVNGNFLNESGTAGLVIKSDATGMGSLIHPNNDVQATIERYIEGYTSATTGWHLISSPVENQDISGDWTPTSSVYDFYAFDESLTNGYWLNQKVPENNMTNFVPGQGYLVAYENTGVRTFTGTLSYGEVSLNGLTNTPASSYPGWHLVGNPFASAIDWNTGAWTKSNVDGIIQVWNSSVSSYQTSTEVGGVIPSMNGFMVHTTGTGTLVIPTDARVHSNINWYKSQEDFILLKANDPDGHTSQSSIIRFNALATEAFDSEYDSYFLAGFAPMFYSKSGISSYSLNTLPQLTRETVIPFDFIKNESADYSLELAKSLPGAIVYLTDTKTNSVVNLTENPVYQFTAADGDLPERFLISIGSVGINNPDASMVSIYAYDGTVFIGGANAASEVILTNMQGQALIKLSTGNDGIGIINTGSLADGIYMVSVMGTNGSVSKKVLINN